MSKLQAITLCKKLLAVGLYARPYISGYSGKWRIMINHPFIDIMSLELDALDGLEFSDCVYFSSGHDSNDYPLYCIKGI
jgi:hypothetical protein